jgi:hypothetical protein
MQNVVIVVSINEADFLRATLPRSRRALPDAKFIVVTTDSDTETKSIASALRVQVVELPKEELTKNDADFNFAAFVRAGQLAAKEATKIPFWMIVTRAQVIMDPSIGNLNFTGLEKDSVYGCATHCVHTGPDLVKYIVQEPSAEEVRTLAPDETFLMTYSEAALFPVWSKDTAEATDTFLTNFVSQYMIQKKLALLGMPYRDARICAKWGVVEQVRIAPVHPNTQETATKNKFGKVEEINKKFGAVEDIPASKDDGRKEINVQQHNPPVQTNDTDEVVGFKKRSLVNPWKAPVDLN